MVIYGDLTLETPNYDSDYPNAILHWSTVEFRFKMDTHFDLSIHKSLLRIESSSENSW